MTKMIPPVPTSAVMMPTPKQKIGFSIASIVGNDGGSNAAAAAAAVAAGNNNNNSNESSHENNNNNNNTTTTTSNGPTSPPQTPPTMGAVGTTHLQSAHPYNTHPHLAHQLSAAQQHALHQHLLLQHHHQQQQQQQQQRQQHLDTSPRSLHNTPIRPLPAPHDIQDIIQRLHSASANAAAAASLSAASSATYSPPPTAHHHHHHQQTRLHACSPEDPVMHLKRERSPGPPGADNTQNPAQRHQPPHTPPKSVSPPPLSSSTHPASPPALLTTTGRPASAGVSPPQPPPSHFVKSMGGPMIVPGMPPAGLLRPFPVIGPPPPPQQGMPDIKAIPPYINAPPELQPQHNPHLIAAAQFQMAAALQAGHVLGPAAAAAAAAGLPPHSPFMQNHGMPRDSYPLYPWLLSRHGRIFPHRFPGNFLLQPFRKPKRIRTAFSPSQLLKLEHAFENNQYVVGAERKALAQTLNLSETQVKVWFQNRRTKHKRMQQEDEKGGGCSERNSQGASCDEDDDELIDMEMDDECPSDEEHELDASH